MPAVNDLVVANGTIRNGRVQFANRRAFDSAVSGLRDGLEVEITVKALRATRSVQQNRFYFGTVIHLLSEYTGYSVDEMHEFLKAKFLPKHLAVTNGNGAIVDHLVIGGSTRKLNTVEFNEYIAQIQQWAAETVGVYIPDPNEVEAHAD